jgi:hypothetical protein
MIGVLALKWLRSGSIRDRPRAETAIKLPGPTSPGKKRIYTTYVAGLPAFRRRCDEIAAAGYTGFTIS